MRSSHHPHDNRYVLSWKSIALMSSLSAALASCGGGGGGSAPPSQGEPGSGAANARITNLPSAKLQWEVSTPLNIELKAPDGTLVTQALSCSSDDPTSLDISPDCTSARIHRLGNPSFTVSGGQIAAKITVKGIPQRHPLPHAPVSGVRTGAGGTYSATGSDGRPWYWGSNTYGFLAQLTDYDALQNSGPVSARENATTLMSGIVSTSIGSDASFALTEEGEIWSWGNNNEGVLGRSTANSAAILPGKVRNTDDTGKLGHIVQVASGASNAAALSDDGYVYTWGTRYALGQGSTAVGTRPDRVRLPDGSPLKDVVQISTGGSFTIALTRSGAVYAWGSHPIENVGDIVITLPSTTEYFATPVIRADGQGALSNIVSISAGYGHSLALTDDGRIYAWGSNMLGELGQGAPSSSYAALAQRVHAPAGMTGELTNAVAISAGGAFSLALTTSGQVYSWGYGGNGLLGEGLPPLPQSVRSLPDFVASTSGSGTLNGVKAIGAASRNGYALLASGQILAWGANASNELGQNLTSSQPPGSNIPLPVKNAAGSAALLIGDMSEFFNLNRIAR